MASHTLSVSQAATELGVSVSSVRRLVDDFPHQLSDSARRVTGSQRRFTQADIEILREAVRLKAEKLPQAVIANQLSAIVFAPTLTEAPTAAQGSPGTQIAPALIVDTLQRVQARLDAIEAQRLRFDAVWLVVAGFIAGLIVGLAAWWF